MSPGLQNKEIPFLWDDVLAGKVEENEQSYTSATCENAYLHLYQYYLIFSKGFPGYWWALVFPLWKWMASVILLQLKVSGLSYSWDMKQIITVAQVLVIQK